MAGWNLALRFLLELAALVGIASLAWNSGDGVVRVVAVVIAPVLAATAWGVFNVPGDPSRSGRAPVVVHGFVRLAIELAILGLGTWGLWMASPLLGGIVAVLVVFHYVTARRRVAWLLGRRRAGGPT